jgi:nucleoside-diphosphate-sugar epimerase
MAMRSRRRVLVTGATGFVGGHVVARLLADGAHVTALVRDRAKAGALAKRGARLVVGELADRGAVEQACEGQQVVVHCAARALDAGPLEAFLRDNVEGTRVVAEAALGAGCTRLVHLSTISVYGLTPPPVVREDASLPQQARAYPYGESKRLAEDVVRAVGARGLDHVILRVGSVYGPGSVQWTLRPAKLARSKLGLVLVDGGRGVHNALFIDDLVDAIVLCLDHPAASRGVFNVTDGQPVTYAEFFGHYVRMVRGGGTFSLPLGAALPLAWLVERAAAASRRPAPITRIAVRLLARRTVVGSERMRAALGFEPAVALADGMHACHRWLAETGVAMPPDERAEPTGRPSAF